MNQMRELFDRGETYGPNEDGIFHAGIRVGRWGNRIEVYGESEAAAEQLRDEVLASWQAAQSEHSKSVPVAGEVVALLAEVPFRFLQKGMVTVVKPNKPEFIEEDDIALYRRPAASITAAELERLRKDAAKVLHAEQIRIAAVAAVREVTGCPDIKGKDGAYLVDSLIVNLIEMQDDAAIAGEK